MTEPRRSGSAATKYGRKTLFPPLFNTAMPSRTIPPRACASCGRRKVAAEKQTGARHPLPHGERRLRSGGREPRRPTSARASSSSTGEV